MTSWLGNFLSGLFQSRFISLRCTSLSHVSLGACFCFKVQYSIDKVRSFLDLIKLNDFKLKSLNNYNSFETSIWTMESHFISSQIPDINILPYVRKFNIKRSKNKKDSGNTRHIIVAPLFPWSDKGNCLHANFPNYWWRRFVVTTWFINLTLFPH